MIVAKTLQDIIKEEAMSKSYDETFRTEGSLLDRRVADVVQKPAHYNQGSIEVIDAIDAWSMNFNLGNAIKYIARCNHKGNKKQDLEKALWYISREVKSGCKE